MSQSASLGVLLDHAQDKIALLDKDGEFSYVNDAAERILGYDPDELIGTNTFDYIHPADVAAVRDQFIDAVTSETYTSGSIEYRFRAADGSWVWFESRMSNVTDEALDGYVVSSRDITDRVTAERECKEISTRLRELSSTTSDVLWMFNSDWSELLFVNPAYESVFGQSIDVAKADPAAFLDAIHPDDVPAVKSAMECLSAGRSVDMEYRVNPAKNYKVWVWVQADPIIEDDEVVRITGFVRDITDRRRRERQLSVMDNLLRHNVRNDMGTILGHAELIEETIPEAADRAAIIRRTGADLLDSAEKQREVIEVLTGSSSVGPFDLVPIVEASVDTVRDRYPDAELTVSMPETAPTCGIDELEAAVLELIENAVTHNERAQPVVDVTVSVGDVVTLTVADDGVRIPSMEASVLTGDHEMDALYHSSGLGFWLVYWVVELSEGSVAVETPESGGNRIRVTLPTRDAGGSAADGE
ncbi:PAS domain-containing sensor histidine kinase [Halonotius terrestris]|uniref:histidine kinase n=1 Tax=Halonotius terrestris TaxID=2487750 RepID=A0A8J8TCL2_9EURY|nr:PAS domain-containing sensor histidine kinase [Halonotius terrestris]TQQ80991.1 PAS domain-containing sensor histidine kinase [Halonotius terrestris]